MSDFKALLIEGVFYQDDDHGLMVTPDTGPAFSIMDALMRVNERHVQISVHHLPPMPPDPTKQGGGCCLWGGDDPRFQSHGGTTFCSFGHHKHPTKLLNVVANGHLFYKAGFYPSESCVEVQQFDGTTVDFQQVFQHHLPGHTGRIAVATVVDIEKMREALLKSGGLGMVEGLGERVSDLKDILGKLKDIPKEKG
ncbi:hypothetical protein N9917_01220 [Deltaproteobacteria bacterium]|nr:hypothetical protein [Deltaproteobacteria bacterium]